jgi:poly(A) polymerase
VGNEAAGNSSVLDTLARDFSVALWGFSAIDRYLDRDVLPFVFVETTAGLSDLARIFEDLRYPGFYPADAAVDREGRAYYFRCLDTEDASPPDRRRPGFELLDFYQDWKTRRFCDPQGIYPLLRRIWKNSPLYRREEDPAPWWEALNPGTSRYRALTGGALILARYGSANEDSSRLIKEAAAFFNNFLPGGPPPCPEEQRLLLTGILTSPRPGLGLELLKAAGFLEELWPELAALDDVDHSKEFHPEGNVWKHTLETFRYRKLARNGIRPQAEAYDLRLSLGLLLHDVGKTQAESSGNHRFAGHAELGARQARRFLERLGFGAPLAADIFYLVRNHMLPAALPRLPLTRTEEIMASPLFPTLMELYRCDESSSFKGLGGYYESSAAYQSYLRHRRNPYRSADGKKTRTGAIR